ncbi:MAG: hypothetical protein JNN17_01145 [Verrucomicrobiaceae bacterium]|nr:hypothetical protein [Verrucomicrobiaceae bacterium]
MSTSNEASSMSPTAGKSFSIADRVALAISIISLGVSLATSWITFFPRNDVMVTLADVSLDNKLKGVEEDAVNVWLAFTNQGNQPAFVTGAEWEVRTAGDDGSKDGAQGGPCEVSDKDFPFLLEPGKVRLVHFKAPVLALVRWAGEDAETLRTTQKPSDRKESAVDLFLKLGAINGSGIPDGCRIHCVTAWVKDGSWKESKSPDGKPIPLFGQGEHISFRIHETK